MSTSGLLGFLARRTATGVLQLVVVVLAVFFLLRALPADPVYQFIGTDALPEQYAAVEAQLGLDKSIWSQLTTFAGEILHGDLGTSWVTSAPVSTSVVDALPISLTIVVLALLLALVVVIPVGLFAALRPASRISEVARTYSLLAGSVPEFWLGLMFIYVGWYLLGAFPSPLGLLDTFSEPPPVRTHFILIDTALAGDWTVFRDAVAHLALPIITFSLALSGPFLKIVRESALDVVNSEFMLYARASGLPRRTQWAYLLRNSLPPVVTLVGVYFAALLGGSVIIETVFSLPGMGVYTVGSVKTLDFPAIQGAVFVLTALSLAVYVVVDVLYRVLDPRVQFGGRR